MRKIIKRFKYKLLSPLIDIGRKEDSIFLAGMGRSGTTWVADMINCDKSYRILFEPFFSAKVKEASAFKFYQYLNPETDNDVLVTQSKKILSGDLRKLSIDRDNKGFLYRQRIIKEVRCNLMLGWVKKNFPYLPMILVIRNPLQVVASWNKLEWGNAAKGKRSNYKYILSQQSLLDDFPIIEEVSHVIDLQDMFEQILFVWCVYHLVPLKQIQAGSVHVVYYENLLENPERELKEIYQYLDKKFNWEKISKIIRKSSSTNFHKRNFDQDKSPILNGWKDIFSQGQVQRAEYILSLFGLNNIYDKDGFPTGVQLFHDT